MASEREARARNAATSAMTLRRTPYGDPYANPLPLASSQAGGLQPAPARVALLAGPTALPRDPLMRAAAALRDSVVEEANLAYIRYSQAVPGASSLERHAHDQSLRARDSDSRPHSRSTSAVSREPRSRSYAPPSVSNDYAAGEHGMPQTLPRLSHYPDPPSYSRAASPQAYAARVRAAVARNSEKSTPADASLAYSHVMQHGRADQQAPQPAPANSMAAAPSYLTQGAPSASGAWRLSQAPAPGFSGVPPGSDPAAAAADALRPRELERVRADLAVADAEAAAAASTCAELRAQLRRLGELTTDLVRFVDPARTADADATLGALAAFARALQPHASEAAAALSSGLSTALLDLASRVAPSAEEVGAETSARAALAPVSAHSPAPAPAPAPARAPTLVRTVPAPAPAPPSTAASYTRQPTDDSQARARAHAHELEMAHTSATSVSTTAAPSTSAATQAAAPAAAPASAPHSSAALSAAVPATNDDAEFEQLMQRLAVAQRHAEHGERAAPPQTAARSY